MDHSPVAASPERSNPGRAIRESSPAREPVDSGLSTRLRGHRSSANATRVVSSQIGALSGSAPEEKGVRASWRAVLYPAIPEARAESPSRSAGASHSTIHTHSTAYSSVLAIAGCGLADVTRGHLIPMTWIVLFEPPPLLGRSLKRQRRWARA